MPTRGFSSAADLLAAFQVTFISAGIAEGVTAKEIAISDEDDDAPVITVDRSNWLSAALGRFKTDPSRILLPCDLSMEYREHMKSLVGTYERDEFGNPIYVFKETGPRPLCSCKGIRRDRPATRGGASDGQGCESLSCKDAKWIKYGSSTVGIPIG